MYTRILLYLRGRLSLPFFPFPSHLFLETNRPPMREGGAAKFSPLTPAFYILAPADPRPCKSTHGRLSLLPLPPIPAYLRSVMKIRLMAASPSIPIPLLPPVVVSSVSLRPPMGVSRRLHVTLYTRRPEKSTKGRLYPLPPSPCSNLLPPLIPHLLSLFPSILPQWWSFLLCLFDHQWTGELTPAYYIVTMQPRDTRVRNSRSSPISSGIHLAVGCSGTGGSINDY